MANVKAFSQVEKEHILKHEHHKHEIQDNQCTSVLIHRVQAPLHLGNLEIGSLREVDVKSGLPATTSTERLELLDDDDEHVLRVRIIGGDHRLRNYSSSVSVHPEVIEGRAWSTIIESFVVDVPEGNTKDETCYFVEALIRCAC